MSARSLLSDLRARGVAVSVDGSDLVLDGPEDALTDELVGRLAWSSVFEVTSPGAR